MEKLGIYVCFGLLVVTLSCTKEAERVHFEEEEREMVELTVRAVTSQTRATDTSLEDKIESVQVFIFSDGALESVAYSESDSVTLRCFSGYKDIYAVVNNAEILWSVRTTPQTLQNTIVTLSEDGGWNVMYGGMVDVYVTPEVAESLSAVTVRRVGARIAVHSITNNMKYENEPNITILRAYITNVVGEARLNVVTSSSYAYIPSVWYNKLENNGDLPSILSSGDIDVTLNIGEVFDEDQYFYCYPNLTKTDTIWDGRSTNSDEWCDRFTRLVVETYCDGFTMYYPISIGGIQSGYSYEVEELEITHYGAGDPEGSLWYDQATDDVDSSGYTDNRSGGVNVDDSDDKSDGGGGNGGAEDVNEGANPFPPGYGDGEEWTLMSLHGNSVKVVRHSL